MDKDKLIVEIPTKPFVAHDPGRSQRKKSIKIKAISGFATGHYSWWVFITGWLLYGGSLLFVIFITPLSFSSIFIFVGMVSVLLILLRGTNAKLRRMRKKKKNKKRR